MATTDATSTVSDSDLAARPTTPPAGAAADANDSGVLKPAVPQSPVARASGGKPHLELELDMLERVHEPNGEGHTDGSDEYSSDLGTPLGFHEGGFGESAEDFSSHRFIGPSVAGDDASARELHGIRRVQIHAKPPRFVSELASVENARRKSSSASMGTRSTSSSRSLSAAESSAVTYSVSFAEASALGFSTDVVVTQTNEVVVQVASVEPESPASRASVVEGDILLSVNGQRLEAHMAESEILEIIRSAATPRAMLFQRAVARSSCDPPPAPSAVAATATAADEDKSKSASAAVASSSPPAAGKKAGKPLFGRLSSAVGYGSSILGSKLKRKQKVVHANSFCDGCGMDPICGALWSCSVCANYHLCGECYDAGTHGRENTDAMQALHEAIVQDKLQKKCKQFTSEFLLSLRRDICKGRPDKFEYMGSWIADIVIGTAASKITVRGIEIPSLTPMARQRFVSNLMPLVSNRTDIEVNIEWLPDDAAERASVDLEDSYALGAAEHDDVEKLRIWISDKKTRTTSPFA